MEGGPLPPFLPRLALPRLPPRHVLPGASLRPRALHPPPRSPAPPLPQTLASPQNHPPQAFTVLLREGISVSMMSQGASKVNISLVVDAADGQRAVKALHEEFWPAKDCGCGGGKAAEA